MKQVTVLYKNDDLEVEIMREAFLTSPNHAMIADGKFLLITKVKPTNDPAVYELIGSLELGHAHDPAQSVLVIESTFKKLNEMTAYEFVTEILMNMKHIRDYGDKIVQDPSKSNFFTAALESGVA